MVHAFLAFLLLLTVLSASQVLAQRITMTPAIVFLAIGIIVAFIPAVPPLVLQPDVVLMLMLPPLIYIAGVSMSWREFKANLRPIALLAIGCVIFTTCAVAAAVHYVLHWPWSVGFVLGAIVSPPDVVAPLAIARRLGLPHRILVILEGEGLANDATALILYRFAVATVSTGAFSLPEAAGSFVAILICEITYGFAVGWLSLRLRQLSHDTRVEISLSLLTPYLAFWVPEHLGGSGVIATVVCGLYMSWNGPLRISAATRLQGVFFWDIVIWLIEGILFLVVGFQTRVLIEKSKELPVNEIFAAIAVVSLIVVVARLVWIYPAAYLPRLLSKRVRESDPAPNWRFVTMIGITGIRGVVSVAVALALPFTLPDGTGFPYRDLILLVSFGVVFVTIVGLGLSLPAIVRLLGLPHYGLHEARQEREHEIAARREIIHTSRQALDKIIAERQVPESLARFLEARHETRFRALPDPPPVEGQHTPPTKGAGMVREIINIERQHLHKLLRDNKITDETRRRIERDLDLEEAVVNNREKNTPI